MQSTISRGKEKKNMKLQHISHPHPLVLNEDRSNQSEETFYCSWCEGKLLGPCFSCVECNFSLHTKCAEAPIEINHPFHRDHPLILRLPSADDQEGTVCCRFCRREGKGFFYGCPSCEFFLDFNCGLLPHDTDGKFIEILHFAHQHPLILIANENNHLFLYFCSGCSEGLFDASYACFDCGIFFHKKCVELPIEINHPYHRKHQLTLEFKRRFTDCNLCEREHLGRLFYCCSLCNVHINSECDLPPPIIEDKNHHEHPFTLFVRPNSFICDACGTQGNSVSYICSTCNLQVHEKCISLPCIIRINLHHHALYRNFFLRLHPHDSKTWDCRICYQKVNLEYGSYYCSESDCDFVIHVNCAKKNRRWYGVIELKNQDEVEEYNKWIALYNKSKDCITSVIKKINIGEDVMAAEITHINHGHNLTFSNEIMDNKSCNGCVLPISSSFYCCAQCDFFLHKACAELPREKLLWFCKNPFTLHTNGIFECQCCQYNCSGSSYKFSEDDDNNVICLRCAALSHSLTYQAHEAHHLFFDRKHRGHCSACGNAKKGAFFRCKDCNFALDVRCVTLPHTVWHKCDEHSLRLAYGDDSDYPLQHYCDICEEERDPKHWFYRCEDCDTTVHPKCVLGKYPFIKPGSNYLYKNHSHPLTFVQKIYDYPECVKCGKPCVDLSLECAEHECNYVIHWECIKPFNSRDGDSGNDSGSDSYSDDSEW